MKNTHITNVTGTLLKATALGVGFAVALTPAFAEVVKVDIKTEAISNMRSQILAAGYLCSNEDLLAASLYYNLDSVREYALTHDGQVPSEYASLIALNNFDVIQERANRVTDTIANINANPESVSKIGGKLSPLSLLINEPSEEVQKLFEREAACLDTLSRCSQVCWFQGKSMLESEEACAAVEEFLALIRMARSGLNCGEMEIHNGNVRAFCMYIFLDKGQMTDENGELVPSACLADEYLRSVDRMGTPNDFQIVGGNGNRGAISLEDLMLAQTNPNAAVAYYDIANPCAKVAK